TGVVQTPATTSSPPATTAATTTAAQPLRLALYFLAPDGKLVATSRSVEQTQTPGAATLHELLTPPSGTTTHLPDGLRLTIADGRAEVTGATLDDAALAQIVYSLTTFPTVRSVNGNTRADVEKLVPPILVEHPSPGESVTSPVNVSGTANTY